MTMGQLSMQRSARSGLQNESLLKRAPADRIVMRLPYARVDEIKNIFNELGWCSMDELRSTNCVVDRFHLLDHNEAG